LISETNADAASYKNDLNQDRACTLEPSSTINGIDYYWTSTSNVDAAGNAIAEVYTAYDEDTALAHTAAGKTNYDNEFNTNYAFTSPTATYTGVSYGYVDYVFYLKAVNTEQTSQDLNLTRLNLLYNGVAPFAETEAYGRVDKAWRVALIVQDITTNFAYGSTFTDAIAAPAATNTVSMFTISGAGNHDSTDYAVGDASGTPTVMDLSYGDSKTAYNQAGKLDTIAAGAEKHYKVIVRVWLEGEDTTCTNQTYATLKNNYTLDLKFEYGGTAVANISNTAVVNATAALSEATATASIAGTGANEAHAGETAASYQWYKVTNTFEYTEIDSATDATYTVPDGDMVFCVITTSTGLKYWTNTVTYTTTP
jgi:hypothetical protein